MTITSVTNKTTGTAGTGTEGQVISFTFPVFSAEEVKMIVRKISTGVETSDFVRDTHYSVSLTGTGVPNYTGGSITMLVDTYDSDYNIYVYRETTQTQSTDFIDNDDLPAETLESRLDKLFCLYADLNEKVNRSLKIPITDPASSNTNLSGSIGRASSYWYFDSLGNPVLVDDISLPATDVPFVTGFTFTDNSPTAGEVSWTAGTLTYEGTSYSIIAGHSSMKYTYWDKNSLPTMFHETNNLMDMTSIDKWIICYNDSGTVYPMLTGRPVHGGIVIGETIGTEHLVDTAVTEDKLADLAVTLGKIAANAVGSSQLVDLAVIEGKIANSAVTSSALAAGSVVAGKIAALAVEAGSIAANAVTANEIAAGSISTEKLGALSISADQLAANCVTAGKIAALAVEAGCIAANAIVANDIAANTITAAQMAANTITANEIAANAITAEKMAAFSISTAALQVGAVVANTIMVETLAAINFSLGNVYSGSMTGTTITGGMFRTATSGRRVQIDSDGIKFYMASSASGKIGTGANGGDDIIVGTTINGGSNEVVGSGYLARFYNISTGMPFHVMSEQTSIGDMHLYPRSSDPSTGTHGDIALVNNVLRVCTDSTPTWANL